MEALHPVGSAIHVGDEVILHSLKSAQYNGLVGDVIAIDGPPRQTTCATELYNGHSEGNFEGHFERPVGSIPRRCTVRLRGDHEHEGFVGRFKISNISLHGSAPRSDARDAEIFAEDAVKQVQKLLKRLVPFVK